MYSILFILQIYKEVWPRRRDRIAKVCEVIPLLVKRQFLQSTDSYNKDTMFNIVNIPKLNLNWCIVPKVASSSISSAILPYLPDVNRTRKVRTVHDELWQRAGRGHVQFSDFNKSRSFLVTRHPFARIASAFRNKLENRSRSHDGEYFYDNYSKQIIR